ncbi:conserved protein of unknown function [Magnetospirillum sp. XM-1]|uniref:DUF6641 family protein n=1 Tax=Magnetospirillum sp. XM-1 TaxID=1663591 RepID=UPI00073DF420|nr:DUF6641 family protein [Magnetospirillum sp. XM-1]CUW39893.1 conserved protein of unknown function [Magnetospirillum sp. XM-1]
MLNLKLSDASRPLIAETRKKSAREVVLDGIGHQIGLLTDKAYTVERTRYSKNADGTSCRKVVAAPPKPWFWRATDGTIMVQVKYGHAVVVEIEPGKPTIIAGKSEKDAVSVLAQVVEAVKSGKLDPQIEAAKAKAKMNRKGE